MVLIGVAVVKLIIEDKSTSKQKNGPIRELYTLFNATVTSPTVEEGIFRGVLQPLTEQAILLIIPASAELFLGTYITIATAVAIIGISVIFGLAHLSNNHAHAPIQAICASIIGIALGFLSAQFGIGSSIAAHIGNNTVVTTAFSLSGGDIENTYLALEK